MPLTTTTIGAYPKPKQTPIQDWFLGTKSEEERKACLLYTSPSPRDVEESRMPSSA